MIVLPGLVLVVARTFILLDLDGRGEEQASRDSTKAEMQEMGAALVYLQNDCHRHPTTSEGLQALTQPPSSLTHSGRGPYLDGLREVDVWGHPYLDQSNVDDAFMLTNYGQNSRPDDPGEADDLV